MKQTATGLSQRYVAALRKHRQGYGAAPNGTVPRVGQNSKGLKNEIASAQRLVLQSDKSVRRFARKLDTPSANHKRSADAFV